MKVVLQKICYRQFFLLVFMCLGVESFAQFQTKDNHTGRLDDSNSWVGGVLPASTNNPFTVFGYHSIASLNWNADIFVEDTLVVEGNFTTGFGFAHEIVVRSQGLLVVLGDVSQRFYGSIQNEGKTVILGDVIDRGFIATSAANNTGEMYVFGDMEAFSTGTERILNQEDFESNPENAPLQTFLDQGSPDGTLPVEVVNYQAFMEGSSVQLQWTTTSEINFDYFQILRSVNGAEFEVVGTVSGNGNSKDRIHYQFVDPEPAGGEHLYELVAVDLDESRESHGFVSTYILPKQKFSISPNPVTDHRFQVLSPAGENNGFLQLYSDKGRQMYAQELRPGRDIVDLPQNLPTGVYVLKIIKGNDSYVKRLLISQ